MCISGAGKACTLSGTTHSCVSNAGCTDDMCECSSGYMADEYECKMGTCSFNKSQPYTIGFNYVKVISYRSCYQKCNTFFCLKVSTLDLSCCYKLCENSFIDVCGNIFGKLRSMRRRQPTLSMTMLPTLPERTSYVNAHQAIQRHLARCVSRVDIYVVYTHSDIVFEPYFHTQYFTC